MWMWARRSSVSSVSDGDKERPRVETGSSQPWVGGMLVSIQLEADISELQVDVAHGEVFELPARAVPHRDLEAPEL